VAGLVGAGAVGALVATVVSDDPPALEASAQTSTPSLPGVVNESLNLSSAVRTASPSVVQVIAGNSSGSGVIVQPRGLIVTNQHVVGNQTRVTVVTADNRRIPADVETSDATQDLAILRPNGVAGPGAQVAVEPDGGLEVGEQVFAIGSPFDLPGTVTAGIVSAVGRVNDRNGIPMIQTDAPINPGNSGGGLFDLRGRLVGIPTAIAAPIRGNVGIGFAVPSSRVRTLLESVD
jgi:S1-C subfamily serine protease